MSQADAATGLPTRPALYESRKAIFAAAIGNVLERYDFGVYVFFASAIARNFFPPDKPAAALLSSFAVFGVGFLMRPLGGIIIGRFGDTRGRKAALMLTIMTMAFGTVLVGVLPGYASIGIAAPALLVVARLIQGFPLEANGAARRRLWSNGHHTDNAAGTPASSRHPLL